MSASNGVCKQITNASPSCFGVLKGKNACSCRNKSKLVAFADRLGFLGGGVGGWSEFYIKFVWQDSSLQEKMELCKGTNAGDSKPGRPKLPRGAGQQSPH